MTKRLKIKLEEEAFIQTVAILREGRHNVTYYGRTARGFVSLPPADDPEEKITRLFLQLAELAKFRKVDVDSEKVKKLARSYVEVSNRRTEYLVEWLNNNEREAIETDIDFSQIFDVMDLVDKANPEYQALYKELFEIFRLSPKTWAWEESE
ncbi:MAG: hypothetical protein ACE5OZ_11135 [Candidatus Heimdallarchaeota archaeon]